MAGTLYVGEASGGRILQYGIGLTQVGGGYELDLETWDYTPAGENGTVLFRLITAAGTMGNGLALGITPIVDGVAQTEQTFSFQGAGEWIARAYFAARGTRLAARVRTLSHAGDVELHSVLPWGVVLRRAP